MNSIVRTREEEVSLAEEVELTDTQLETVFGAWHNKKNCCHKEPAKDSCKDSSKKLSRSREVFQEQIKVHFEFDFELDINEEVDSDFGDDWD